MIVYPHASSVAKLVLGGSEFQTLTTLSAKNGLFKYNVAKGAITRGVVMGYMGIYII